MGSHTFGVVMFLGMCQLEEQESLLSDAEMELWYEVREIPEAFTQ